MRCIDCINWELETGPYGDEPHLVCNPNKSKTLLYYWYGSEITTELVREVLTKNRKCYYFIAIGDK